jgi:hypothetical protein
MLRVCTPIATCLFFAAQSHLLHAQSTNVLTWHNEMGRSGANITETILNTKNVAKATFGKICSAPVDGAIYAQPLIVTNVPFIGGGKTTNHDVVYIATQNDSLFAFDANNCSQLAKVSVVPDIPGCTPGVTCEQPVNCKSIGAGGCNTVAPSLGILSTPAIDVSSGPNGNTGTIYLVAETQVGAGALPSAWRHRIHALDITTLLENPGSPGIIQGTFGSVTFKSGWQIQRTGLLLLKNAGPNGDAMVYFGFSLMDGSPKRLGQKPSGWIFGYDTTNLSSQPAGLPYIFNTTPNGVGPNGPGGGVWQAGAGLAGGFDSSTDTTQYIYFGTGDGTFDAGSGGSDYADSFVKLNPQLELAGYFTRSDEAMFQAANIDFGSGGMMLVPDNTFPGHPYISINAGKDGNFYVIDRANPGGFTGTGNTNLQTVAGKFAYFGTPAYWNGHLYDGISGGILKSWHMSNSCSPGPVCPSGLRRSLISFPNGLTPSVSSNGNTAGTGIVWAILTYNQANGGNPAILYAFDAVTLVELYDSNQCGTQDTPGLAVKFTVPTVANGKTYIGTQGEMDVYGPISPARVCP